MNDGSTWIDRKVELSDIAVIGRNRYLFEHIEHFFSEHKIDYTFGGVNATLECETAEMKIFEIGMRVLANPYDDLHYGQVNSYLGEGRKN